MRIAVAVLLAVSAVFAQDWHYWLNEGVRAFKTHNYAAAAEAFQKAVALQPDQVSPHLYLGTTWMSEWSPGGPATPANQQLAANADAEFQQVLRLDPNDPTALTSLANLSYLQAAGLTGEEKNRKLDESKTWNERLILIDPQNKEAYLSLGVIAWGKSKAPFAEMRKRLGMKPEDPGPLRDAAARQELQSRYSAMLEDGISNLEKALVIDPAYCPAMTYLNLLIRKRADLRDTEEEYEADRALADQWMQRAASACPPRSPSQPRLRIAAKVQEVNLIHKVDPEYPPLAQKARIQGTVRFSVTIGKDGRVQDLQLISGHPLLVTAAKDAVRQWEYKPTLLNGDPIEVLTTVDVNFRLPPADAVN